MRAYKLLMIPMIASGLTLGACTAEQTQEGELPSVEVEGGELPRYNVETAEVEIGTDTQVVEVPDVDIRPPSEAGRTP